MALPVEPHAGEPLNQGQETSRAEELQAELQRLQAEIAELRRDAERLAAERLAEAGHHRSALEESRAETAQARLDRRENRREAIEVERRFAQELASTTSSLTSAEQLVAELMVTEASRQEDERRQHVLNQEMSHRLKNTFSMVLAIATQTLKGAADRGAVEAFKQRIFALSTAHDVLLQRSWTAAPLEQVAGEVLARHADPGRFRLHGPDTKVKPEGVLSLSLLLHELATNAVKYGALSTETGTVEVSWRIGQADGAIEFHLSWSETGGPQVTPPTRVGFGSRLINAGLGGTGGANLRYPSDGVRAEFRCSAESVTVL